MTDLATWLAGLSFCSAVLSVIVSIAEHNRANEAERRIVRHLGLIDALLVLHGKQLDATVADQVRLAQQDVWQAQCLRELADKATGFKPEFTHISVPGPGRMQ